MLLLHGERIQSLKKFMQMAHGGPFAMGASLYYNYIQLDIRCYNMCKGQQYYINW